MLVVLPYCKRDQSLARKLLGWIAEMGEVNEHDILLVVDDDVDHREELQTAQSCFKKATAYPIDPCSTGWPFSQNNTWKRAVDYIEHFKLGPFLYLESDAVPLCASWLTQLAVEYAACGKFFMGYLEYAGTEAAHMNGVAVYQDIARNAPSLLSAPTPQDKSDITANKMAFDMSGAAEVMRSLHVTKLIQFRYKEEEKLLKDESLSWLKPEAVLFHTEKTGRLIDLLRARRKGTQYDPNMALIGGPKFEMTPDGLRMVDNPANGVATHIGSPSGWKKIDPDPPRFNLADNGKLERCDVYTQYKNREETGLTCDLFIKTCTKHRRWFDKCEESAAKFVTGIRRMVVVGDEDDGDQGYLRQQIEKLNADKRTDADLILFTDSDTLFTVPVTPQTYMCDGKTIWTYRSFARAVEKDGDGILTWEKCMEQFLGMRPRDEFMERHPELVPRWLLQAFRTFCWQRHGCSVKDYVMRQKTFSEWNVLGFYAWTFHREAFSWINTDETNWPMTVRQFWTGSHAWNQAQRDAQFEQDRPEMETILGGELSGFDRKPFAKGMGDTVTKIVVAPAVKKQAMRKKSGKPTRTPERIAADRARMAALRARKAAA